MAKKNFKDAIDVSIDVSNNVSSKFISKEEKIVFSFRETKSTVEKWRTYAKVKGMKVGDLGSLALEEYIANHSLSEVEQTAFDTLLANQTK